jgi:hypothetical protein
VENYLDTLIFLNILIFKANIHNNFHKLLTLLVIDSKDNISDLTFSHSYYYYYYINQVNLI